MLARALLASVLALGVLCAPATAKPEQTAAPPAAHAVEVGIGDQKPDMFTDKRFDELGIGHARLLLPWDAMSSPWQRGEIDAWMTAARRAGVEPLVTFGHSRSEGLRRSLPTQSGYRLAFARFHRRYPWVRNYATWNEANHCGEPTCHKPALVAGYWRAIRAQCPSCRVLAAELLDMPNMTRWVKAFRKAAGSEPRYWGLHNYIDANRFRTRSTAALVRATKGEIWLTETGGIVKRRNRSAVGFRESPAHAASALRWLFDRLIPLSPRITRVYLYHWNSTTARDSWDSAFVDFKGRARPSLEVLRNRLLLQR
jgi:hypothetical protein